MRTARTYQRCAVKGCPFITPGVICADHGSDDSPEWAAGQAALRIARGRVTGSVSEHVPDPAGVPHPKLPNIVGAEKSSP